MGRQMKKVLLLWYMEDDNFGDVLLSHTVSSVLQQNGFEVEFHEVGDDGREIFKHANQCDFMLFAGGGIIERYVPPIIRHFKTNIELLKVPYGVMGFGMGTFDYTAYKDAISLWVRNAEFFFVRDEATKIQLDEMSQTNKVIYSADCVFGNQAIRKIRIEQGMLRGANVRDLPYKDLTGDFDWEKMNSIMVQLAVNSLIPDSSKELDRLHIVPENMVSLEFFGQLDRLQKVKITIEEIAKCDWIVAMRFHVVLVAAMLGIVTVPIMYCPKVKYLTEQLGLQELALEIEEYKSIPEKVHLLEEKKEIFQKILKARVEEIERRADEMFAQVVKYLLEMNLVK